MLRNNGTDGCAYDKKNSGHLTLVVDRAHFWFSNPQIQELSAHGGTTIENLHKRMPKASIENVCQYIQGTHQVPRIM